MNFEEKIKLTVEKNLECVYFELINESNKHHGHIGDDGSGQTHFKLVVVSPQFEGMGRVMRHRLVNNMLAPLYRQGLHSVSLDLLSPSQHK